MREDRRTRQELLAEVAELRSRLEQAEAMIMVISPLIDVERDGFGPIAEVMCITTRKEIEEVLQESKLSEMALNSARAGLWDWNILTGELTWSEETYRLYGLTPNIFKPTYENWWQTIHPDDRETMQQSITRTLEDNTEFSLEFRILHPDGTIRWIESRGRILRDDAGQLFRTIGICLDITAQKQAEEALKDSEERYRRLVDLSPDALLVHAEGRYVFANPAAVRLFGAASPEQLQGQPVLDLVHPRHRDQVKERMQKLLRGETVERREFQILRLDGRPVDVEAAGVGITYQGKPAVQVVMRDITARQQAEEELRKSTQLLDLLAETASKLLASASPQTVVDSVCQKAMAFLDCDTIINFLIDGKEGRLHLNVCAGIPDEEARRIEWLDFGVAVCGTAARDGCRIVTEDILATTDPRTELVKSYGIQAYACHPLMAQGRVLGTLSFGTRTRTRFTPDELALMKAVADLVAIAIERKQAEDALKTSEARERARAAELQTVLDAVPAYIFLAHDPDCRLITCNPATYELLRLPPGSNVSLTADRNERPPNFQRMKDGKEIPVQELPIYRAAAGQIVRDYESDLVHAGGASRHLLGNAVPLLDETGRPRGAVAAFIDVTVRKQAEEALRESEEKFRAILDNANDGILLTDAETSQFTFANKTICQMLGYGLEEIRNLKINDIHPRESLAYVYEQFNIVLNKGIPSLIPEIPVLRKDGSVFFAEINSTPMRLTGNRCILGIFRDTTERKLAEEALRQSERELSIRNRIAQVFLTLPDEEMYGEILHIILKDTDSKLGVFAYLDEEGATVAPSMSREVWEQCQIPDKSIRFPRETWGRSIWGRAILQKKSLYSNQPGKVPQGHLPINCVLVTPVIFRGEVIGHFEVANKDTGYGEPDKERLETLTDFIAPILSSRLQRDREEKSRRQAEEALKTSEARFKAIFEGAPIGIGLVDLEGRILVVNPAVRELLGFWAQEMVGRQWSEFIHCQDLPANLALFQKVAAGRLDHYHLEERYRRKDGHYLWADLSVSLVRGAEGQPLFAIVMGQDIMARREAEEKVRRYHKLLQGLAAQMEEVREAERQLLARELHDRVGQNLGVLGINLNLVQSLAHEGDKDQIQDRLADAMALVEQTVALTRDLMTELRPPELDDYGLLEALRWHGVKFYRRTNIAIDVVGEEPALRLDPPVEISLFRIAQEALTNVAKHAQATRVTVIQEVDAGSVRLTIADNGMGFVVTSLENAQGCQGWGMITMTERAAGAGGHCRIESTPGKGTRVIVEMPR